MLDEEKIAYDYCPGVSSFCGAAAALDLEYTLPNVSQSVVITRMAGRTPVPEKERDVYKRQTQGRMHDKYVIVDELAYILGGRNTFDYFIGDYPNKNMSYDREVLIYNTDPKLDGGDKSSLYQVEEYFERMWKKKECRLFHDCLLYTSRCV